MRRPFEILLEEKSSMYETVFLQLRLIELSRPAFPRSSLLSWKKRFVVQVGLGFKVLGLGPYQPYPN